MDANTLIFSKQQFAEFLENADQEVLESTTSLALVGNNGEGGWMVFPILDIEGASPNLFEIPPEIAKLKNLKELYMEGLAVKKIPDAFYELIKLKRLYLNLHGNLNALERGRLINKYFKLEELYLMGDVKNAVEHQEFQSMFSAIKANLMLRYYDDNDED